MRTTISLDDTIANLAAEMADRENRNFSNLCEVALTEYCTRRAPSDDAELVAAIEEVGTKKALAALRRAAKRKRAA